MAEVPLHLLSSMATRQLLAELAARFEVAHGLRVQVESVGGVTVETRVAAGEVCDGVVLAADAIERLAAAGHVLGATRVDLVRSDVYAAVRSGAVPPDLGSVQGLQRALRSAASVGWSTGPSGVQLGRMLERWGLAEALKDRVVVAPAGVPVAKLVAEGRAALGFQQLSELMGQPGIDIVGPLPEGAQIVTVFTAAVAASSQRVAATQQLLAFMAAPAMDELRRACGMRAP